MTKEELKKIRRYTRRNELDYDEAEHLQMLLLKWMYEQGMLQ